MRPSRQDRARPASALVLSFAKLQGAGNGYVVIDGREHEGAVDWAALARAICHPRLGVGSDGLALASLSQCAPIRMRIFNSDGSESEMSGNGIRLFAKFVLDRGLVSLGGEPDDPSLDIETGGGVRRVHPRLGPEGMISARVAMGPPRWLAREIPVEAPGIAAGGEVIDLPLRLADRQVAVTCLSLGNPHAVAIVETPVAEFPLHEVGPLVTAHASFPNRINFEVVNVLSRHRVRARIYERGEGETLASGTGSTASVLAAWRHGRVAGAVDVEVPGGVLKVTWDGAGEPILEGPASEVFSGRFVWDPRACSGARL